MVFCFRPSVFLLDFGASWSFLEVTIMLRLGPVTMLPVMLSSDFSVWNFRSASAIFSVG